MTDEHGHPLENAMEGTQRVLAILIVLLLLFAGTELVFSIFGRKTFLWTGMAGA